MSDIVQWMEQVSPVVERCGLCRAIHKPGVKYWRAARDPDGVDEFGYNDQAMRLPINNPTSTPGVTEPPDGVAGSSHQRMVLPPCEWHGCYAKCGMPARYEMMDENWANAIPICSKHQSQASSLGWQTRVRQNVCFGCKKMVPKQKGGQ